MNACGSFSTLVTINGVVVTEPTRIALQKTATRDRTRDRPPQTTESWKALLPCP